MKDKMGEEMLPLQGRTVVSEVGAKDLGRIMYMPAGKHFICCALGETAVAEVTVEVGRESAAILQSSLAEMNAEQAPQRALFDKEHEHKEAMAWPLRFEWSEAPAPGVYAVAEYSSMGRSFVEGKVLRAFSPSFYTDADLPKRSKVVQGKTYAPRAGQRGSAENPARITGLYFPFAGTFTNNPAFREILPLWAKNAGASGNRARTGLGDTLEGGHQTDERARTKNGMEKKAELQAKKASLEQEIEQLGQQEATAEVAEALQAKKSELGTVNAQLEAVEAQERNAQLEAALVAQRTKDAKSAVSAAVKRGALPAKDMALQAKWEKKCRVYPDMFEVLNAVKGSVALERPLQRLTIGQVKIVREDSGAVLNAFAAEKDPRKRAALYAREIVTRVKEGDEMPLHAATVTPGTLAGTLVTQRTLELLKYQFPVLSRISTDFSDQSAQYNQTINTRIVMVPDVQDYNTATGWPDSDVTFTDVNIKLSNHKGVPITFNAQTLASTVRRLFDEIAPAQAYALAKSMVDALYAKVTAANFTNAATQAAKIDFGRSTVIDMGVALTNRGVPQGSSNRSLLLNADYYGQLLKDQAIVTLAANQAREIITGGVLPDVHGFYVIEAPNLPITGNLQGFGFSRSAMCIVTRLDSDYASILPGASYGNVTTVMDPDLGIAVLQVQYVNHQLATATQRISLLYGVGAGKLGGASGAEPGGQENAGQLLTT